MNATTIPWIERTPEQAGRMRSQALSMLWIAAAGVLLVAIGCGLPLFFMAAGGATRPDSPTVARTVMVITVVAPIAIGLVITGIASMLWFAGKLQTQSFAIAAILGSGGIPAGIINYFVLAYAKRMEFDPGFPYVFGLFLLLIGPILLGPLLATAALVVWQYKIVGKWLPKLALWLFIGFVVVGLIIVPWAHKLLFEYFDDLTANSIVNGPATSYFGYPFTVNELATYFEGPWRFIGYLLWPLQFHVVRDFIGLGAILGFINLIPLFGIWWERKVAGRIQSRLGPMRVGGWHGWAQSFADGIKLIFKEDFVPPKGDGALFRLAPYLTFVPAVCAFIALPFGSWWAFRNLDVALIFILAMVGIEVVGVIIAGWASNNKWSVYGSMREACQMVSYEIPMGMALLIPVMTAGTLNLIHIVDDHQTGGFHNWIAFRNPFCFAAAFVYYIASLASCKRAPFDLPESESELVAGFHTEYSGFRWSLFFFAEYAVMYVVCGLCVVLFLGGWLSPLPESWAPQGSGIGARAIRGLLVNGPLWFVLKSGLLFYVQLWIRWTLPRIRIDQVLYSCIQVLLPFTMVLLLGNTFWLLLDGAGYAWFRGVGVIVNALLALIGVGMVAACGHFIWKGWSNNKRLVGSLVIDHLPGA